MKQLKSSLRDLRKMVEQSIMARDIAESLISFDDTCPAPAARGFMEKWDFDEVGVRIQGSVAGYVRRNDLGDGTIGERLVQFGSEDVVTDGSPLVNLFRALQGAPRLYVESMGAVGGIVTRGDMQKTPVRMWLFGLVSLVELQMLRLVRESFPNDSWQRELSPKRLDAAENILADRQKYNEDVDLIECLQFCDKRDLLLKRSEIVPQAGLASKGAFQDLLDELERLRNQLAHSNIIAARRWAEIADLANRAETLLERLEKIVPPE